MTAMLREKIQEISGGLENKGPNTHICILPYSHWRISHREVMWSDFWFEKISLTSEQRMDGMDPGKNIGMAIRTLAVVII